MDEAYWGTVYLTSSDGSAVLPAAVMLTDGVGTFTATLTSGGDQTITATDASDPITGFDTVAVGSGAAAALAMTAPDDDIRAGASFQVDVIAHDAFGNQVTSYDGTIHFTSSDPAAVLPPDGPLAGGSGSFTITLMTLGPQELSVADSGDGGIDGDTENIVVRENINLPPVLAPIGNRSVPAGGTLAFTLSATDPDGDELTYDVTPMPPLAVLGDATGAFLWQPSAAQIGEHEITFGASDGMDSDSETMTITVTIPGVDRTSVPVEFAIYNQGRGASEASHVRAFLSERAESDAAAADASELAVTLVSGGPCESEGCTPRLASGTQAGYAATVPITPGAFGRHSIRTADGDLAQENADGTFTLSGGAFGESSVAFEWGRYFWVEADSARDGGGRKVDESRQALPVLVRNDAQKRLLPTQHPMFSELTHLSATFTSSGGTSAPRLDVYLEGHGKLQIHIGNTGDSDEVLNGYSGTNLLGGSVLRFDTTGLTSLPEGTALGLTDHSSALAVAGDFVIDRIEFVIAAERQIVLTSIDVEVGAAVASAPADTEQ